MWKVETFSPIIRMSFVSTEAHEKKNGLDVGFISIVERKKTNMLKGHVTLRGLVIHFAIFHVELFSDVNRLMTNRFESYFR